MNKLLLGIFISTIGNHNIRNRTYRKSDKTTWKFQKTAYQALGIPRGKQNFRYTRGVLDRFNSILYKKRVKTCFQLFIIKLSKIILHIPKLSYFNSIFRENGTKHLCVSESCPQRRKLSFTQEPDNEPGIITNAMMIGPELLVPHLTDGAIEPGNGHDKPELTCISEEGIADMDLPDNLLDDLDYVGDCITSCNKVIIIFHFKLAENEMILSIACKKTE